MSKLQEVKIVDEDGHEVFFFQHNFKSAFEHAEDYIERNKDKHVLKVYHLNKSKYLSRFRPKWLYVKTVRRSCVE